MSYPDNFDQRELDIHDEQDLCPERGDGRMAITYYWRNGVRGDQTGDLQCQSCDFIEHGTAIKVEKSITNDIFGLNLSYEQCT